MARMESGRIRLHVLCVSAALLSSVNVPARAGDWTITPSLSDQEQFTDNIFYTPVNTRSDLITTITPGITISGASSRLQGTLSYSPIAYLYALTPKEDTLGQNLYANEEATVIPDTLFIDAKGYATLLPSTPGLSTGAPGPTSTIQNLGLAPASQGIPPTAQSQAVSLNFSPYLVHRFDGYGTGELRYTLSDTDISAPTTSIAAPPGTTAPSSRTLTNEGTASFLTGEFFGPFLARLTLDDAQSSGTGIANGASQLLAIADTAYAIARRVSLLITFGHENIDYNGIPPTRIDDLVWGAGFQLTPATGTSINVSYGHRNGATAPDVSIVYSATATTTLSATYSEGLSTTAQDIASNLAVSDVNAEGQLIDTRTLLPTAIANPALGLQNGLFKTKQFTGTANIAIERNNIAATISENESLLVAQSAPGVGTSQNSTNATLNWAREIGPLTTGNLSVGYTRSTFPSLASSDQEELLTFGASISYMFSDSLKGWAGYNRADRTSPDPALRLTADTVFAGLSKTF
jgi:uncharacterized protein (PEP-CTERM system associated)